MAGEWLAQLPADLQGNEQLTGFATLGDFAKSSLETHGKLTETEGKLTALDGEYKTYKERSIPKLPDNATDEDKNLFYTALGRPEKAEGYELDGEKENAAEWNKWVRDTLFSLNVPQETAKGLSKAWNEQIRNMVEAHNTQVQENIKKEIETSSESLKVKYGDKLPAMEALADRMWSKRSDAKFDEAFKKESSATRFVMIDFLLNLAKETGEDVSPQKSFGGIKGADSGVWFPNSPPSPTGL